ncbi:hypothetical protein CRE_13347 [Caenorhabditis remanei]|uniref:Uncharacterized protein n=1 Tax=Caenorhabditis remanei TaxID=31234 RepID=E3M8B3_CAERE|nr:hypothetical protein CRE_13347 [Caenorhabditis remanei]
MSSSDRRFSVTLSEDDLRPHMRKPSLLRTLETSEPPKLESLKEKSEIEELRKKMEKREEVKREVKRRVEEEEREKERKKRDEEIRKETQELLAIRDVTSYGNNATNPLPLGLPKLGRRVNNFQYFRWDSDEEIPVIPLERAQSSLRTATYSPFRAPSSSSACELCTLALRSLDKSGAPTKSAACAHVDAFVASSHHH